MQARNPKDPMGLHEENCIKTNTGGNFNYTTLNALNSTLSEVDPSDFDGIIIGGSGDYSAHHPKSQRWVKPLLKFMEQALDQNVPGFGLCFGHQLLGTVMGSTVETDLSHAEVGTVQLSLTEAGKNDPVFGKLPTSFFAQTGHSDYVTHLPSGITLLVSGGKVPTQAFRVDGKHFYSTQFHPDLSGQQARERYRAYREKIKAQDVDDGETLFLIGKDDATKLLSHFGELLHDLKAST